MKTSERERQRSREQYRRRKASGICIYCPNRAETGHIRCAVCKEITADYCAGRRDIWKLKGLCGNCGKQKPEAGRVNCESCLQKARKGHRSLEKRI